MALAIIDGYSARRFDGASKTARFSQWRRPGSSADVALAASAPLLRNGSRDLTRNNPYAEKALTVIESNTVGTGIIAQVQHPNEAKRKKLNDLWVDWTTTTDIDADERLDLVGLENLIIRTIAESGEVIVRRRFRRGFDRLSIPIQVQVLEPDYLDSSKDGPLPNGGWIKGGIEFDKRGKRTAYYLYEEHPGDSGMLRTGLTSYRIGAADVIHAFDPKRAGQSRGYPWVASAIRRMKDLDDYEDAQLVRQKIAACFTGFIHDMNAAGGTGATGLSKTGPTENQLEYLQPGTLETLPAGKDIKFPSPPGVENYAEYTTTLLRSVAAAYGITYEALTGDYSKVNFSSGRMGWIEMSRNVHRWQNTVLRVQVLERIARWFIGGATLAGYETDDEVWLKWTYPRREMLDPTSEIPALIKGIRGGLTSLQRVHASLGYDTAEVIDEIEQDNKRLDEKGIILDSDPRRVNISGSKNETQGGDGGNSGDGGGTK